MAPLLAQANRQKMAPDKVRKLGLDLLLRLLFLRFLEAKGWILGDESWLLHQDLQGKQDAYGEVLLPLFTALAQPEGDRPKGLPAVAYLNGGLFDPQAMDLDGLTLPVKEFKRFREFLYAYAFTVEESTPVDQKVAIDAEMLGRVFETLVLTMEEAENAGGTLDGALESGLGKGKTRRKVTGSYYTPRVIVQYLCRQTLDAYLTQATGEAPELWAFLRDKALDPSIEGPKGLNAPRRDRIETALKELRVCDPAVGSGAFLLGMMHELLLIWHGLRETEGVSVRPGGLKAADWKRHIITENLYGVDLNPEAVDICRLRLWLSLVIEAETPEPLPALDFRVLCGNSLIDRIGEHALPDSLSITSSERMGLDEVPAAATEAEAAKTLKAQFAQETRPVRRRELREQVLRHTTEAHRLELEAFHKRSGGSIASLQAKLSYLSSSKDQKKAQAAIATLQEEIALAQKQLDQLAADGYLKQPFLWKLAFPEVFEAGGFHLVVGNPPYVRQESQDALSKRTFTICFPNTGATADLYGYFLERSHQILRPSGQLGFITSNGFTKRDWGKRLAQFLAKEFVVQEAIDFGELKVFEATVEPFILVLTKAKPAPEHTLRAHSIFCHVVNAIPDRKTKFGSLKGVREVLENLPKILEAEQMDLPQARLLTSGWRMDSAPILDLYDRLLHLPGTAPLGTFVNGRMYYGIKTGLNQAFVIDEATRAALIHEHPSSAALIKPWLRGKDVKRWKAESKEKFIIALGNSDDCGCTHPWKDVSSKEAIKAEVFFEKQYPALHRHMKAWETKLKKRSDQGKFWWELRACAYYQEFEQPKIIWPSINRSIKFAWDDKRFFGNDKCNIITNAPKWLLGLLNSELFQFLYCQLTSQIRGSFMELKTSYISPVPIKVPSGPITQLLNQTVDSLISGSDDFSPLETKLDNLVYQLYSMSSVEQAIIQDWFRQRSISVVGDDDEEEDLEDEA